MSNIRQTCTTIGGEINIWDSEQRRFLTGGVTIDSATVAAVNNKKILRAGYPLGKITASGKYGPYASDSTDGRQTAVALLAEEVDVTLGDEVAAAVDAARVIEGRLPITITATIKAQLPHITFVIR